MVSLSMYKDVDIHFSRLLAGAGEVGKLGNKCHIDCSNRGICDYSTGECKCFSGMWGTACDKIAGAGRSSERVEVNGSYEDEQFVTVEGN